MDRDRVRHRVEALLHRITGEQEARDALAGAARELRHPHLDLEERRRRQSAAERPGENPRRGVRRGAGRGATSARG
jgi:hypothetical protein